MTGIALALAAVVVAALARDAFLRWLSHDALAREDAAERLESRHLECLDRDQHITARVEHLERKEAAPVPPEVADLLRRIEVLELGTLAGKAARRS